MSWREKIKSLLHNLTYVKQERGAIFVLTALLLPVLFGFMGLAYDVGNLYMHKARLQNVTDAAALAGAALYKNPPQNNEGENIIQGTDEKNGTIITLKGNHTQADTAAREYINKNKVNLGNDITVEELSALQSATSSNTSNNVTTAKTDVYYRVIASETVPLHFLPVIMDKSTQEVRTVSVAITETTTTTMHGTGTGGGSSSVVPNSSIFDNLYTYSEYFDSGLNNANDVMSAVFIGDMVFTYGNGSSEANVFYNIDKITGGSTQSVDHLFSDATDASTTLSTIRDHAGSVTNSQWNTVNDPIIDTFFNTTAYVTAFTNKLHGTHIDVKDQNALTDENINNLTSDLYKQEISVDGVPVRKKEVDGVAYYYRSAGNDYAFYAIDPETNTYMSVQEGGVNYPVYYVRPQNGGAANYVCKCIKIGDVYYLLNQNGTRSNCYVGSNYNNQKLSIDLGADGQHPLIYDNGWKYGITKDGSNFNGGDWYAVESSQVAGGSYPANLIMTTFDANNDTKYTTFINSNVFYVSSELQGNVTNLTININSPLTVGNVNEPIYIIIGASMTGSMDITISDNEKPIILVYLGTGNLKPQNPGTGHTTKLTIYAPYGTVGINPDNEQINFTGTYYGNIIARRIAIQASGGQGVWHQQNFLENSNYTDADVAAVSQATENMIKEKILPDNIKADVLNRYATSLGKEVSDLTDPLFYSKLGYYSKQVLYGAWKQLQIDYPQYANYLWPWNEHFDLNTEGPGEDVVTSDTKLRLINPRTEVNPYFNSESNI